MSHTLTETSNFDATVVVPDGTDPRSHAAEDVAAIAQALANRTRYLLNALGAFSVPADVARIGTQNVFTVKQAFTATNQPTGQAVVYNPASGSGKWAHAEAFRIDSSHVAHVYMGSSPDTDGGLCICWNAYWSPDDSQWHKHDGTKPAVAVILYNDRARFAYMNVSAWSTWADDVRGGTTPSPVRIELSNAGLAGNAARTYTTILEADVITCTSTGGMLAALRLPQGALLKSIDVVVQCNSGGDVELRARRVTQTDWGATPAVGSNVDIGGPVHATSTSWATINVPITGGSYKIDNSAEAYYLGAYFSGGGGSIVAARANWGWT
jgi:hypothetical protein